MLRFAKKKNCCRPTVADGLTPPLPGARDNSNLSFQAHDWDPNRPAPLVVQVERYFKAGSCASAVSKKKPPKGDFSI